MRIIEFFKLIMFLFIEFFLYTVCGILFYRNYSRFYWKRINKIQGGNK